MAKTEGIVISNWKENRHMTWSEHIAFHHKLLDCVRYYGAGNEDDGRKAGELLKEIGE